LVVSIQGPTTPAIGVGGTGVTRGVGDRVGDGVGIGDGAGDTGVGWMDGVDVVTGACDRGTGSDGEANGGADGDCCGDAVHPTSAIANATEKRAGLRLISAFRRTARPIC
jgi:hypothetical protein